MRKFSIIIPIYNVERYIDKCILSVLAQSYESFEVILIDDGSTDQSSKRAKKYVEQDKRVRLIKKENGGLSDARNAGLSYVTGDYVIFLDSDDYWFPDLLETLDYCINKHKCDIAVFGYSIDTYNSYDELVSSAVMTEKEKFTDKKYSLSLRNKSILGYAWNKAYSIGLFAAENMRFEKGTSYIEDVLFNAKAFSDAKSVLIIDRPLVHYVQRERLTLGRAYYQNMEKLDLRANDAFRTILEVLKVQKEEREAFLRKNILSRLRWTSGIIANTSSINRNEKNEALIRVANNLFAEGISPIDGDNIFSKLYIWIMRNNHMGLLRLIENVKAHNCKRFVLDEVPSCVKDYLVYITSSEELSASSMSSHKKIYIMLAADYGNLGDVAITYAQERFLKEEFSNYDVVQVPISQTYRLLKSIKKTIKRGDIVTIIGGGNMGNLYLDIERQRRFIIKKLKMQTIISFPQTIDFSDDATGIREMKKTTRIYGRAKNLVLLSREEKSYRWMKRLFVLADVYLTPDIVLSLNIKTQSGRKCNTAVLCIRNDAESTAKENQGARLKEALKSEGYEVMERDTHIGNVRLTSSMAKQYLESIWYDFGSASIVITDRLHGMIFCAITRTPCIAINNKNGKVKGVYDRWLSSVMSIKLVEDYDIPNIKRKINEINHLNGKIEWRGMEDKFIKILRKKIK